MSHMSVATQRSTPVNSSLRFGSLFLRRLCALPSLSYSLKFGVALATGGLVGAISPLDPSRVVLNLSNLQILLQD